MTTLRLVLGDQLSRDIAALSGIDPKRDIVLMVEVAAETTYVKHHQQKIALILSVMRHFAAELRAEGVSVDYVTLDANGNTGFFRGEVQRALARHRGSEIVVTHPGEWRALADMLTWQSAFGLSVRSATTPASSPASRVSMPGPTNALATAWNSFIVRCGARPVC